MTLREEVISGLFIIILCIIGYNYYSYKNYMEKEYSKSAEIANNLSEKIELYKDDNKNMHSSIDIINIDKKAYSASNKIYLDSISKLIKIKTKNIKSISNIVVKTNGTIKIPPQNFDTPTSIDTQVVNGIKEITTNYPIKYSDGYLSLNGNAKLLDNKISFKIDYNIYDSILIVNKIIKKGFLNLGKSKLQMDISSTNKNSIISYAKSVNLSDIDKRKYSIGLGVFYGFDGIKFKPFIGIGISKNLLRF